METSVRMIIMSHLSDMEFNFGLDYTHGLKVTNFCKFLLLKYPNTSVEVNPDVEWKEFTEKHCK